MLTLVDIFPYIVTDWYIVDSLCDLKQVECVDTVFLDNFSAWDIIDFYETFNENKSLHCFN